MKLLLFLDANELSRLPPLNQDGRVADKDSDLFFEPSSIAKMASEGTSNEALVVAINSGDPYNAFWDIFHFAKELHLQTPF